MRSLKMSTLCILFFLLSTQAFAESMTLQQELEVQNQSGSASQVEATPQTSNQVLTTTMDSPSLYDHAQFALQHSFRKPDYSEIRIKKRNGESTRLTNKKVEENQLTLTGRFFYEDLRLNLVASQSLQNEFYNNKSYQVEFQKDWNAGLMTSALAYQRQETIQPEDYFTNRNFQTTLRPTTLSAEKRTAYLDAILHSQWKSRSKIFQTYNSTDRPSSFGFEQALVYIWNSKLSLVTTFSQINEATNEPLKNERGYFENSLVEEKLFYEFHPRLLAEVGYGLEKEIERNRFNDSDYQLGLDHYLLGINYRKSALQVYFKFQWTQSNGDYAQAATLGGFKWEM